MVGAIPPAHIFLVVTGKFIKNYIIKLSEGKCNFNEKNDYANNFDGRLPPRLSNTGLVSCRACLNSWGEGASLALVGHPSSDGIKIKMPYGVDVLHRPASHPIFSYWVR